MPTKHTAKSVCSHLQKHRCKYQPVLPNILKKGPAAVKPKLGKATKSVADQAAVKRIFPNTYGLPEITFVKGTNTAACKKAVRVADTTSSAGCWTVWKKPTPKINFVVSWAVPAAS